MSDDANRRTLRDLLAAGRIALEPAPLLDAVPAPLPVDDERLRDRVEGMLLGLAIGDSLGNTSEGRTPAERRAQFGEIRDYLPNWHAGNRRVGLPSDDTQLAFRTLESLLAHRGLDPEALARDLSSRRIFGMGGTVRAFLRRYRGEGLPWHEAAIESAGDGALMRIAPVLVPHLRRPSVALWADTALAAMITHNDRASTGSCIAFVHLLRELIGRTTAPEPPWWIDTFIAVLAPLEGDTHYRTRTPHIAYEGPLWRFVDLHVRHALARDMDTAAACDW